jgi:transcriptional regulator with XRE-family HTH domain
MIESGKRFPSPQMLEKIAAALCIDTPELFSVKPLGTNAIENLRKEILLDLNKIILKKLEEVK